MITKRIVLGMISILETGMFQIRHDTILEEDGVELNRTYHRTTFGPEVDISDKDEIIQKIAAVVWTPEVIEARKKELERLQNSFPGMPPVIEEAKSNDS